MRAGHDIVAVGQSHDAGVPSAILRSRHVIADDGADQAVGGGNDAMRSLSPRRPTSPAMPVEPSQVGLPTT